MSPSYQTDNTTTEKDVLVIPSKMETSSARTMLKKVGFAVLVGGAVVVGNSYGSPMNTPTTEIEAFLSSMSDLSVVADESLTCSGRRGTMYSVAPFVSEKTLPGTTICGQLCILPEQVAFALRFAPEPKPVIGDCPSRGYTIDSGKFFNFIPIGSGFFQARVFTAPPSPSPSPPYIQFKDYKGISGNNLKCGGFGSQKAIEDFCNSNLDCMGYKFGGNNSSKDGWCAKTTSEKGRFERNGGRVWYQKQ